MTAFYNEIDPYAAQWLRNLIAAGHIAPGVVDTRSIEDITPDELQGFAQVHFFAGVGVWSYALRQAGWPDDRPVWTGSCPCQPFSTAGKGKGFTDERHLWPHFHYLIEKCAPSVVFGEQVASNDGLAWFDLVQTDLEKTGYAATAFDLCAAGIGAPHIRQRLYWVAYAHGEQYQNGDQRSGQNHCADGERPSTEFTGFCSPGGLAYANNGNQPAEQTLCSRGDAVIVRGIPGGLADSNNAGSQGGLPGRPDSQRQDFNGYAGRNRTISGLANADSLTDQCQERGSAGEARSATAFYGAGFTFTGEPGGANPDVFTGFPDPLKGQWAGADWLLCRDGKFRAVESGAFPLANGASERLVCACAKCGSETLIHENVLTLRRLNYGEGCHTPEILRARMLSAISAINAINQYFNGTLPGAEFEKEELREVLFAADVGSSPQGSESVERCPGKFDHSLHEMPSQSAFIKNAAFDVRRLWKEFSSGITPERKQNLFCPLCKGMGAHVLSPEMGGSRVGRLRAYGNALTAPVAQTFIRAYMEVANDETYAKTA